jgi:methionyl-tRNA formyltransferase
MLATIETPVADKTTGALTDELARAGAALMVEVLAGLDRHPPRAQPDEGVTYAAKIEKHEATLDFTRPADEVLRQVRAFAPAPGAFFVVGTERVRILAAGPAEAAGAPGEVIDDRLTIACGSGAIRPTSVQRAGRGAMTPAELLRGFAIPPGTRL